MRLRSATVRRAMLLFALAGLIVPGPLGSTVTVAAPVKTQVEALAALSAPLPVLTGNPMSAGLGPTYGEAWCANAAAGSSIAGMQGSPLALIPYEAIGCMLARFETQRIAAGLPQRMSYSIIGQSAGGRNLYGVIVNALETPEQVRDYERWQTIRDMELTDPAGAQALLASYGADVKIPIYVENNIHGDEEEGADAMMQSLRDLTSTPRGVNPRVDDFLDHAILITVPNENPDGRFSGTRANGNGFDMNRDWLVQSQSEVRAERALIQQWIPTVGLATHGYVNPTLIDGLTKPHNPGLEYDLFAYWNQRRLDANQAALAAIPGAPLGITRPNGANGLTGLTSYCSAGSSQTTTCGTNNTIAASPNGLTMSGSTVTVTTTAALNLNNQIGTAVTITGAGNTQYNGTFTITSMPTTTSYTFTHPSATNLPASGAGTSAPKPGPSNAEGWDDWGPFYTQTYLAFLGPDSSTLEMCSSGTNCNGRFGSKRAQYVGFWSSSEFWIANRNGLLHDQLEMFRRGVADEARVPCCTDQLLIDRGWRDQTQDWSVEYPKAYVIPMNNSSQRSNAEANRMAQWLLDNGISVTTMTSDFTWGSTTFAAGSYVVPMNQALRGLAYTTLAAGTDISTRITQLYAPPGAWSHGLLWGADTYEIPRGDATFSPTTTPIGAVNAAQGGIRGGTAAPADFYSVVVGGVRDFQTIRGLLDAGVLGHMAEASFVSTTGGAMPAGTLIFDNEPETRAAIDAAGVNGNLWFERNVGVARPATTFVNRSPRVLLLSNTATPGASDVREANKAMWGTSGTYINVSTLTSAAVDPLLDYDVIVNLGQAYPASGSVGRTRLNAFFNRGGGYIATLQSTTNLSFMTTTGNLLVNGTFSQGSQSAGGGIPAWTNVGGLNSPITGFSLAQDYLYMPGNTLYFSAIPTGAVVDGRYRADMVSASATNGPSAGYVAGLWRGRSTAANNAAVVIHGTTLMNNSRYMALAAQVYSRQDAEREWGLLTQAALWTNLTDEAKVDQTITFASIAGRTYGDPDFAISPSASSGRTVSLSASGNCSLSAATSPADVHITGAGSCSITASQAGTTNYNPAPDVIRTFAIGKAVLTVTPDPLNPSRQYSDPHPTITTVITGYVLGEDASALTTVPTCVTAATPASAPAVYPIVCSGGVAANYSFSYSTAGTFTITREDAVATYTGDSVAFTAPGGSSASVLLRATVQDSSLIASFADSAPGDIRNATVTFKEGSTTLCTSAVTLIAAPITTGTASCTATLGLDDHVITVVVNGYYTGSDDAIVMVVQPDGSYIAGGGHIAIGTSAGTYAGNDESKLHFGYHVRYLKNLKNLVGKTLIRFKSGGRTYEISTSSTDSLGLALRTPSGDPCVGPPSPTCLGIGDFRGKAKLTDVTNSSVTVANNLTLQITMTDRGTPATYDSIGITLTDGSTLVFSSNWNGARTVERLLTGGNLFVN